MDWLKVLSFIIPSIALIFSFNARLKRFNNERISVYKDMKPLASELKMEDHEIKVIDNHLKKLILREATGIYDIKLARRLIKILSCNPNLEEFKVNGLKKVVHCILEKEHSSQENVSSIEFYLEEGLFKKRAKEGSAFIIAFFIGYFTLFMAGYSSIAREAYFWATSQIIISFALLIAMLFAVRHYPAPWAYKAHKKIINELKGFSIS